MSSTKASIGLKESPWYRAAAVGISVAIVIASTPGAVAASTTTAGAAPTTADTSPTTHGFLTTRDGTRLRYALVRPARPGRFPVLINYQGYAAGADPSDRWPSDLLGRLIDRGYAVLGVSVRGTGCSEGAFDPFSPTLGRDGADAVEWAARQAWSNGRVGMVGVSFGGISQLATAAQRPPHLRAIAPSSATSDFYRDVVYPGGILEYGFTFGWAAIQKGLYATAAASDPDPQCAANYATHEAANATFNYFIPTEVLASPFADDSVLWSQRAPNRGFRDIDVPIYLTASWQDEQLPARIFESLAMFRHPERVWANFSNGNHGRDYHVDYDKHQTLDFLDHFVRGVDNGFRRKVAHLTIAMETAIASGGEANTPAWNIRRASIRKVGVTPWPLYLGAGSQLTDDVPHAAEPAGSYRYPLPASDIAEPAPEAVSTGQLVWKVPPPPGGAVAYTSGPLDRDAVVAGPASLDLWLASTATDTDLQATITEVRPDGQEVYIQRGWLRASHRQLDPERSTVLRPYQTHLRDDAAPLTPGRPTLLRVEIFPFAYAFRKGSRIRVWIDAPTGHTGFWGFVPVATPAQNTILHTPDHASRLVLGQLVGHTARAARPACDTLRNEPCRRDPYPATSSQPLAVPTARVGTDR